MGKTAILNHTKAHLIEYKYIINQACKLVSKSIAYRKH